MERIPVSPGDITIDFAYRWNLIEFLAMDSAFLPTAVKNSAT